MLRLLPRVVATSVLCLAFSATGAVWAQYAITDLGVLSGYAAGVATGVNSSGVVVGYCNTVPAFGGGQAFVAAGGPPMTDLNSVFGSGAQSAATGISDTGLVSGIGTYPSPHAVIYNTNTGVTTDLTTMPGFLNGVNSWTYAVNNSGQAVGYSAGSYPFFYDGSTTTEIPGLGTQGNTANAYALNNSGAVVGGSLVGGPDPTEHPFIWTPAGGSQPLFSPIDPSGDARGVNDGAVVVGGTDTGAFYATTVGGSVQSATVGALGAATDAGLLAVNDLNQAVGWSCTDAANTIVHAAYYRPSTGMIDLSSTAMVVNLDGWTLTKATAISSNGRYIVGYGTNPSGQIDAFELKAVLPGDANGDGKVDINDLTIVLARYGQTGMTWTQGDFNNDGKVDINDLTIVLARYGQSLAASDSGIAAVPEPGAVAILWSGLVFFLSIVGLSLEGARRCGRVKQLLCASWPWRLPPPGPPGRPITSSPTWARSAARPIAMPTASAPTGR